MAVVGVSIYAFLYIRSGLQPRLDEADPETRRNVLAVVRSEQLGSRGVFDNPLLSPGPENHGRTLLIFGQQLVNFFQYCSRQWARALPIPAMVGVSLLFVTLAITGFELARRRDRGITVLLAVLWLVAGPRPGPLLNFHPTDSF